MKNLQNQLKKAKTYFEENLLDGGKINDCGGAMLSAKEVWLVMSPIIVNAYKAGNEEGLREKGEKFIRSASRKVATRYKNVLRKLSYE